MRTIKLIFITLITLSRLSSVYIVWFPNSSACTVYELGNQTSVYIHYEIYIRDVDYITNQVESLILKLS